MTLSLRGDINPNGITFKAACASGSNFYTVTTENRLRKYSITNTSMQLTASATPAGVTPSGITFIAAASVVVAYSGGSRVDIYDANTLANLGITTNAPTTFRPASQQIAGNTSLNLAMTTNSTTGRVTLVGLTCCATITPAVLASQTARCVLAKTDTNTWLIVTNNGKIHEINSAGTALTTVNVPSAPAVSAPTICVESLSYYNGMVLATTDCGEMLTYTWPAGVLTHRIPIGCSNSASIVPVLCPSVSGTCLASTQGSTALNFKGVEEIYFEAGQINIDSTFFNETSSGIEEVGIEPGLAYAWLITTANNNVETRILNITSTAKASIQTRIQNPIGNDIAARVIRIRDCNGIGNACVELDQTVFPGPTNLSATEDRNYIEVVLMGNIVNGNPPYTAWDIREFQS